MAKNNPWWNFREQFVVELHKFANVVNRDTQKIMISTVGEYLEEAQYEKGTLYPVATANLHDSIVGVVSNNGRVVRAQYMPEERTKAQRMGGRKRIIGAQEAFKAVKRFNADGPQKGLCAALLIGVPYTQAANKNSKVPGFVENMEVSFSVTLKQKLRELNNYNWTAR